MPRRLEQEALARVHHARLDRGDPEETRVELVDVLEEGAAARVRVLRGGISGHAVPGARVPAPVRDRIRPGFELAPERGEVRRAGETARHADDRDAVVLVPESGDGVQAMKAGLMEVADLFVINKSDRPGADRLEKEIAIIMSIRFANRSPAGAGDPGDAEEVWRMPITQTVASEARGIEEFAAHLDRHFDWLQSTGKLEAHRRAARLRRAHDALLRRSRRDAQRIWRGAAPETLNSGASPYAIARRLYEEFRETLRGT